MSDLQERMALLKLYDLYRELMTAKQREVLDQYLYEDFLVTEIANNLGISRQAVHIVIKKGSLVLREYEEKLHFAQTLANIREIAEQTDAKNVLEYIDKHGF